MHGVTMKYNEYTFVKGSYVVDLKAPAYVRDAACPWKIWFLKCVPTFLFWMFQAFSTDFLKMFCLSFKNITETLPCHTQEKHEFWIKNPMDINFWNHLQYQLLVPQSKEKSCYVALILCGQNFKSFVAPWAEDFDTFPWTANQQKDFYTCFYSSTSIIQLFFS